MTLYIPESFYKAKIPLSLLYRHPDLQVRAVARFGELQILPDIVETYKLGVNAYIVKPVDFDQFRETVKSVGLYWLVINQPPLVKPLASAAGKPR